MMPKIFGRYPRYNAKKPFFWYVFKPQSNRPLYCPVFPTAKRVLITCITTSEGHKGIVVTCLTVASGPNHTAASYIYHNSHCNIRGAFKKFCNSTIKNNGIVTNNTLFFNIITTEFNAFATVFWQTVNSTKIEIFCLSLQPLPDSLLERFIVRIADTTKVRLQIAKQKIVTGSQVRTVCRVV